MTMQIPLEITHVREYLRTSFTNKVPEAASGTVSEKELNFLSRALAAFAIHKLSGCTLDMAADAVVDGGGDGGIDAIYHAETTNTLWIVQSKFHNNGRGEPDLGSVSKFKDGLEYLLDGNLEAFQSSVAWQKKIAQLPTIFDSSKLKVRAVLAYTGTHEVSDGRRLLFEKLRYSFGMKSDDYFETQFCNLGVIHNWFIEITDSHDVPKVELKIVNPAWIQEPFQTVYGQISLSDLAALYVKYGKRLIAANIRGYKGNTLVNKNISATIRDESQNFFYLNNGLTAYCEQLSIYNVDRRSREENRITVLGLSIVNGAQTLVSIANYFNVHPNSPSQGYVFIKIISLQRQNSDRMFANRITHSTNFQNQISARDFAALDSQQERIARHLRASGITYHYKDDVEAFDKDETNFTIDEATTACASLSNKPDCDFCARVLADRKSLWSFDIIYPESELYRSRYSQIFRGDLSARTVWRAVQTQRLVINALKTSETGVRKDFFVNCRWLILDVIFLRLRMHQAEPLALTNNEEDMITKAVQEYAERLWIVSLQQGLVSGSPAGGWESSRHFRSVFSSATDCQRLRNALLANLANTST